MDAKYRGRQRREAPVVGGLDIPSNYLVEVLRDKKFRPGDRGYCSTSDFRR